MSIPDKRFKVVQDAWGVWGILDTTALEFDGVEPFAGWEGVTNVHKVWIFGIFEYAAQLNKGEESRDTFDWTEYAPRELAPDRIPV